ncbi:MAG: YgjV family protein [Christensenellales bacterium]
MTTFILSQVFICISACIYSISLILKTKQKMLFLQMISSIFFITHYFLLDAKLAGFVAVLETIRLFVFFFIDKKEKLNKVWIRSCACLVFSALSIVTALFTWNAIYCLLPLVATIVVNITLSFKNVFFYKIGAMIYSILIISYLFIIGSIVGGISQCVAFVFSVAGIVLEIKNIKSLSRTKNQILSSSQQEFFKQSLQNNVENKKISQSL